MGYSQKLKELEFEGSILSSDLDIGIAFGFSLKYNYWVNPYIGLTVGGNLISTKIDLSFESPYDSKSTYYLDSPIFDLNASMGLKVVTPTYKNIGLMTDFIFMFAPIPFNYTGIDKKTFEPDNYYPYEKNKDKMVYTYFNPSYALELSLFYERKNYKKRVRISIGAGISNYNMYNTYYRAKVDGISPRDYLKLRPNNNSLILFIRLTGGNT